jgi:hypothetical protein
MTIDKQFYERAASKPSHSRPETKTLRCFEKFPKIPKAAEWEDSVEWAPASRLVPLAVSREFRDTSAAFRRSFPIAAVRPK